MRPTGERQPLPTTTNAAAARLALARRVLAGVGADVGAAYDGMNAAGVISLAHGNGVRRPHPDVLAAGVAACGVGEDGWSLDDYHSGRRYAPLEDAVRRDVATSAPQFAADVCVAAGTAQLVTSYLHAFARPGDALLVARPHYHGVIDWCAAAGVELVTVRTGRDTALRGGPADLDAAYSRATGRRVCGLLLANPTFTGAIYGGAELAAVQDWAGRRDATLLVDTAFRRTEYGGRRAADVCGPRSAADGGVLVLGGVSKAYNLANLRVAWAVGARAMTGAVEAHRERVMGAVRFLSQAMAAAALAAPAAYLRENAAECASRAAMVARWVAGVDTAAASRVGEVLRVEHEPEAGHAILLLRSTYAASRDAERRGIVRAAGGMAG